MKFEPLSKIQLGLCFDNETLRVGTLASREQKIFFEYDPSFLERGLEISPLKCPLRPGLQSFQPTLFEGLPGVFNDSLPDGWGRLLLDRKLRALGILPEQLSCLDRLAHVGACGMGALLYEPDHSEKISEDVIDLTKLAFDVKQVLDGESTEVLKELIALNGSSAGARPKAMIGLSLDKKEITTSTKNLASKYQACIVKFPNFHDGIDAGAIEYVYALMAKKAGLLIPETHLLPADQGPGYFAVNRFDRNGHRRLHMHSASGLLHSDYRLPSLDYEDLIALTMMLTKDIREVEKLYRLAVFNTLSHNRDDHAKNFSFLMDETGEWKLAPAYDLTFSSGPGGEQSTTVLGEGRNPGIDDLQKLGREANLAKSFVEEVIDKVKLALLDWGELANTHGVEKKNIAFIGDALKQ